MDINIDGLKIAYKFTGSGDTTAVILQGWATSYPLYDVVAMSIASNYRVLQFDLPGFGASQEPPESWNVDQFTDFFIKLMEALEIKKVVLIGHSYGGRMIIKLLARDNIPFEIEKVVLIDSAGVMPKRSATCSAPPAMEGRFAMRSSRQILQSWRRSSQRRSRPCSMSARRSRRQL